MEAGVVVQEKSVCAVDYGMEWNEAWRWRSVEAKGHSQGR